MATLADRAIAAGFGLLGLQAATRGEWEEFERAELDKARSIWLRGHRGIFGFAYLTLGVP